MKRFLAWLATGLVCGAMGLAAEPEEEAPYDRTVISDAQALDIAEATFRYQFLHNASGQQQKAPAYFLKLFGKDPDEAFLKRFAANQPPVHKGSEFAVGKGLVFRVEQIRRLSPTRVEVSGGYYEGNLSSSGNRYVVELKDGKWVVTGDKMDWISWRRTPPAGRGTDEDLS